jgi:hypothetical protein
MNARNEFDDSMLENPQQNAMRDLVSKLPEESLSMAWRSSLNEKLMAEAVPVQRKRSFFRILQPALGVAAVAAMATVLMVRSAPVVDLPSFSIEQALVQDHRHNMVLSDLVGAGLNPLETTPTGTLSVDQPDWIDYY